MFVFLPSIALQDDLKSIHYQIVCQHLIMGVSNTRVKQDKLLGRLLELLMGCLLLNRQPLS